MRDSETLVAAAAEYVQALCSVTPNRRTGSAGNRNATEYFAKTIGQWGYAVDTTPFRVQDYESGPANIEIGDTTIDLLPSPYTQPVDVQAPFVAVETVEQIEAPDLSGAILLMRGELCEEQLMPKNFAFYNPEHHQRLYEILERKAPAGIITATGSSPEQVGALHPFPLLVDGDFDIPSAYCTEETGLTIASNAGKSARLRISGRRIPAEASNVVARLRPAGALEKVVITAHIDAYETSPGASDNASGVATMLLIAEMLADYPGPHTVEIVAINGEDHYSAGGEMDYLARYGDEMGHVRLAINIDDVGYVEGGTHWSGYELADDLGTVVQEALDPFAGLTEGEQWYSGDHMVFVQAGRPAVAFTAEQMPELMKSITHTDRDTPDVLEPAKLVELAEAVSALVRAL